MRVPGDEVPGEIPDLRGRSKVVWSRRQGTGCLRIKVRDTLRPGPFSGATGTSPETESGGLQDRGTVLN